MTDQDSPIPLSRRMAIILLMTSAGSITTQTANGERDSMREYASDVIYAQQFDGSDLSAKLMNALNSGPLTNGTIRITAKPDGSTWQWHNDVVLDLVERRGVAILVDDDVLIDYTGSGTMIEVDNTDSITGGHPGQSSRLTLQGGLWRATGDDPDCWVRIKDSIGCRIQPNEVNGFSNRSGNATAVSIENHASYSENTQISGRFSDVDRGVDFVPVSETEGSGGTSSFHDTYLENVHINAFDFCIRLRGNFDYSLVANPSLFAKADGTNCLVMDTDRADGTVITAIKCESPGDFSDTTAVFQTAEYDQFYAPVFVGGRFDGFGIDHIIRTDSDETPFLGQIRMRGKAIELINWGTGSQTEMTQDGSFSVDGDLSLTGSAVRAADSSLRLGTADGTPLRIQPDAVDFRRPFQPPVENLAAYGDPGRDRVYAHHTGEGGFPEGLYFAETDRSQWTELAGDAVIPF